LTSIAIHVIAISCRAVAIVIVVIAHRTAAIIDDFAARRAVAIVVAARRSVTVVVVVIVARRTFIIVVEVIACCAIAIIVDFVACRAIAIVIVVVNVVARRTVAIVANVSPQAPTTVGTAISWSRYARCARPRVDPFLICLERYLVNGSNHFVRRLRVIADVTLVRSTFIPFFCLQVRTTLKLGEKTVSEHRLVIYQVTQKGLLYNT